MRRKFLFQSQRLEERCVLAGNVNIVLSGANLKITGDTAGNDITVLRMDATHLQITGNNGTNLLLNGAASVGPQTVTVADFTKLNLSFDMKEGADVIALGLNNGIEVRSLKISTGTGADNVTVENVFMSGTALGQILTQKSNLRTEADADIVNVRRCGFVGGLRITTGHGDDTVAVEQTTQVDAALKIDTSEGNDTVNLDGLTLNKTATIALGNGDNTGNFSNLQINGTAGTTVVSGGQGVDTIIASDITARHALTIGLGKTDRADNFLNANRITATSINVYGGFGRDTIVADSITAPTMEIVTGDGTDQINATNITSNTSLKVDAGAGDNDGVLASNINALVGLVIDGGKGLGDMLNFTLAGSVLPAGFGLNSPKNFETKNIV